MRVRSGCRLGARRIRIGRGSQSGDFAGLLKDMKGAGIDVIELCSPSYAEFASLADGKATRKIIDDNGLKCLERSLRDERPADEAARSRSSGRRTSA